MRQFDAWTTIAGHLVDSRHGTFFENDPVARIEEIMVSGRRSIS
jgi:hypothetical protein